jgi:hypothetical protein
MDTTSADNENAATSQLLTAAVGDRCASCQAPLASDQRFCIKCGERRGKARVSFAAITGQAAPATAPPRPPRRRPRASASMTFVAGVGTLLLAMGVGVLIGHTNNNNPAQRASVPAQVITVAGGAGGSSATSTSAARSAGKTAKHSTKTHQSKSAPAKITKKTAQAATAAASKVLGSSAPANPTVKPGQTGHGAGYKNGKFTGSFFGP